MKIVYIFEYIRNSNIKLNEYGIFEYSKNSYSLGTLIAPQDPRGYEVFRHILDDFRGDRCPSDFSEDAVTKAAVSEMQRRRSGRLRLINVFFNLS